MKKILFVDDEIPILNTLKRIFWDMEYEVFLAENGIKALEIIEKEKIDLIVSDMRIPEMDGYQLLQRIKEQYPRILRVILSGYSDEKLVFKALQKNIAKVYLFKPWDNEMLRNLIENLFKTEDILVSNNLLSMINNAGEIPTIKVSYRRILELTEGDADINEISKAIERDQSIASKMLHIANSAFYGLRTASIQQAVKYLGLKTIRNLVFSTPIIESMQITDIGSKFAEMQWNHAFFTNKILDFIYEKLLYKNLAEVEGTAGLLHNIGIAFLLKQFRTDYMKVLQNSYDKNNDLSASERETFQISHTETGGYLLHWWEIPFPTVEAALYHHEPFHKNIINSGLVMAVHLAQHYAYLLLNYTPMSVFYPDVFDALEIDREKFKKGLSAIRID